MTTLTGTASKSIAVAAASSSSAAAANNNNSFQHPHHRLQQLITLNNLAVRMMQRQSVHAAYCALYKALTDLQADGSSGSAATGPNGSCRWENEAKRLAALGTFSSSLQKYPYPAISSTPLSNDVDILVSTKNEIPYTLIRLVDHISHMSTTTYPKHATQHIHLVHIVVRYNWSIISLLQHERQHHCPFYLTTMTSSLASVVASFSHCHDLIMALWSGEEEAMNDNDAFLQKLLAVSAICLKTLGQLFFAIGRQQDAKELVNSLSSLRAFARELQMERDEEGEWCSATAMPSTSFSLP